MTQITDLAKEYERKRNIALFHWWKLNEKMDALLSEAAPVSGVPPALLDERRTLFSAIREITEQFSFISTEDRARDSGSAKRHF